MNKKRAIAFLKDVNESIKKAEPFQLEYKEGWYKKILIILVEDDFNNFDIILNLIEKNKELEKGNRSLMESRIKWKNRYYRERAKNKKLLEEK